MTRNYDVVIIGGGFFGLGIAEHLSARLGQKRILILEKEVDAMQRASYRNQARVHNGYHYPRSLLTSLRSRMNFPNFVQDFAPAIVQNFDKYYAVARTSSKVSAQQFELFCKRIDAEISDAPGHLEALFDDRLIEKVFTVKEYAFDANLLKQLLLSRLAKLNIDIEFGREVKLVESHPSGNISVQLNNGDTFQAKQVFNCAYSMINNINIASGLPVISLKHELAEMSLVKLPAELEGVAVTVMCGPFFSFMPFPHRNAHTLSHVRYTPHSEWQDGPETYKHSHKYLDEITPVSHFPQMYRDAVRYIPALRGMQHLDSLWEIKTVLPQSEEDDSRPILFKQDYGLKGYTCVMGGKLDNIYDVFRELDKIYA